MTEAGSVATAFDHALAEVDRAARRGLRTVAGESAASHLESLRAELAAEREAAIVRGAADASWVRRAVRGVVAWAPDAEVALIAALGAIARAGAR